MSLTFPTTALKKPSGLTAIPSGFKRPAFGSLYGFDAQGDASGGGGSYENLLAGSFDGTEDYLDLPDSTALETTAFTWSAWFYCTAIDRHNPVVDASRHTGVFQSYHIRVNSDNKIRFASYHANDTLNSTTVVSADTWYHVVATHESGSDKLYVNGSLEASGSASNFSTTDAADLRIGSSSLFSMYHQGLIDEVSFFNSALSASDVTSIYNSGVPADLEDFEPVGWWRMGDGTGDTDSGGGTPASGDTVGTVVDQGSGGNDATGTNGPTYSNDRPYALPSITNGYSSSFDGTNEHVSIASSSDFEFGTGDFTMSVWFNASTIDSNPGTDYYSIIDLRGSSSDIAPTLYVSQQSGYRLYVYNGSTVVNYNTTPTTGQWYHVAYTRSGTTGTIYLNGTSVASGTDSANYNMTTPAPTIGKVATSATGQYFDGKIDEFSLFDSALSASHISAMHYGGTPNDISSLDPVGWWRMGDDATWGGTNWAIPDASGNGNAGTTQNMAEASRVTDTP